VGARRFGAVIGAVVVGALSWIAAPAAASCSGPSEVPPPITEVVGRLTRRIPTPYITETWEIEVVRVDRGPAPPSPTTIVAYPGDASSDTPSPNPPLNPKAPPLVQGHLYRFIGRLHDGVLHTGPSPCGVDPEIYYTVVDEPGATATTSAAATPIATATSTTTSGDVPRWAVVAGVGIGGVGAAAVAAGVTAGRRRPRPRGEPGDLEAVEVDAEVARTVGAHEL
jgi:hypothetical protein